MFRPLASSTTARWRPANGDGLEHLTIAPEADGYCVRSSVVGTVDGVAFGASYEIALDADWRALALRVRSTTGRRLSVRSLRPGSWADEDGTPLPALDGAIDVDLSATPFTNTLPIRRLALSQADGEVALRMLYVPFPTLEPFPDRQFYRALGGERRYRFENDDRSFSADLSLDADGLVLDYPTLFKRL